MADQPEKSAKIMSSWPGRTPEGSYSHLHLVDLSAIIQLRDSQKSFTHNLEEEPHAAKYPILPNTANLESFATKTGPPAPAQFVSETNRSSPAPSQPCPS